MQSIPMTIFSELDVGDRARVVGYPAGAEGYFGQIMRLGLTPGTPFRVVRVAPLGDPMEIEVRGFRLSLRRAEAGALEVERL